MESAELKILLVRDGSKPYAENAGGDVLSTFNKAVLGQLLMTADTFELQAVQIMFNSHNLYSIFLDSFS